MKNISKDNFEELVRIVDELVYLVNHTDFHNDVVNARKTKLVERVEALKESMALDVEENAEP